MKTVYLLYLSKLLETVTTAEAAAQVLLVCADQQSLFWLPEMSLFLFPHRRLEFYLGPYEPKPHQAISPYSVLARSTTPYNNINGWNRSLLYSNHLNILSRSTIYFLYLGYQLRSLLNHMVDCSAISTCCSWVPTVSS